MSKTVKVSMNRLESGFYSFNSSAVLSVGTLLFDRVFGRCYIVEDRPPHINYKVVPYGEHRAGVHHTPVLVPYPESSHISYAELELEVFVTPNSI